MTFRGRLIVAMAAVAVVPLAVYAFGVRREITARLASQDAERVDALVDEIERLVADEGLAVAARLDALAARLEADNRFRRAIHGGTSERPYLLDLAQEAQAVAGLDMLWVQGDSGRVLSSGHFRNEFDRAAPLMPPRDDRVGAVARIRLPDSTFVALVRTTRLTVGDRDLALTGGVAVASRLLGRLAVGGRLAPYLLTPTDTLGTAVTAYPSEAAVVWQRVLPFVDLTDDAPGTARPTVARLVVAETGDILAALFRGVDRWLAIAVAALAVIALVSAWWMAVHMTRPLAALAAKTAQVDLDRLDVDFATGRSDEVGALSHLLGAMASRLRESARRLRDAERRATVGDLARQVNHDIKNGLIPIRNVFRHLGEVARDDPERLGAVFDERRTTVESGIGYLEGLASNYAKLTPSVHRATCSVNAVAGQVVRDVAPAPRVHLVLDLADDLPDVSTDAIVLRRILENLVGNAIDSLDEAGTVTITTRTLTRDTVGIAVRDTGKGMTERELERAFSDFYTTKVSGTGLGLSVVRRLVADLGGTLRASTAPGNGTTFEVELPIDPSTQSPSRPVAE